MPEMNLDGKSPEYEKVYVPVDSYEAEIVGISDPFETKGYDSNKIVMKRRMEVRIGKKTVPMFMTDKVTKGSGSYSNSKLYDLLEKLGLLDEVKKNKEKLENSDVFTVWFNDKMGGKKVKVLTKTVNKMDKERRYSVVDDIIKVVGGK